MNIDNQTVLHIKAGQVPPADLLARILATTPTAFGFAVQEADGADMQVVREDAENLNIENLNDFLTNAIERPKTLYFGSLKAGFDPEDIQPFTITDGDGNTFMSIFSEGTINGQDEPAAHTEHYNLINGVIIPKIIDWCQDFDGDLDKIMAKINGDVFNKDYLSYVGHRGILHILPFKGEAVLLAKNELGGEFDWGWTSRLHGFGEVSQEPVKAEEPKKKGWWGGNKKATAETEKKIEVNPYQNEPPVEQPKKEAAPPQDVATKGTAERKLEDKPAPLMVRPPDWLHKNEDIKAFYTLLLGHIPGEWKKRTPCQVKQNHKLLEVKNLDEFKKWQLENLKEKKSSTATMQPQTKQERVAQQPAQPAKGPTEPTDLPIISPKEIEKVLEFVAQHLDGNSKEIVPPHEMQKMEAQLPLFSDAVGVKLEEMLNWPVSGLFGLAATDPKAAVLWGLQWRAYARPYLLAELKAKAKDGHSTTADKVVTKTTDLGNGGKRVESVAPATVTAKKNTWGYGKNKAA